MQQLQFKKLSEFGTIPTKANNTDAGFDLYAIGDRETRPVTKGSQVDYIYSHKTGIAVDIPPGYVGLIWPRSGLTMKTGYQTLAGVIDAGYHGDVTVVTDTAVDFGRGVRIAQLVVVPIGDFEAVEVEEFTTQSARGTKGWGSSGE